MSAVRVRNTPWTEQDSDMVARAFAARIAPRDPAYLAWAQQTAREAGAELAAEKHRGEPNGRRSS